MAMIADRSAPPSRTAWYNDAGMRGAVFQVVLVVVVTFLIYEAAANAVANLQRAKVASGFGFFDAVAGFDISQRPIDYTATSTYGRAFVVGLLNTLIVSAIGIVLATILGFAVGVARLSNNWLVAKIATVYVEFIRNIPLLLQLLFWYGAVLKPLPGPRQSAQLYGLTAGWPNAAVLIVFGVLAASGLVLLRIARRGKAAALWARLEDASGVGVAVLRLLAAIAGSLATVIGLFGAAFGSGLIGPTAEAAGFLNNRGLYIPAVQWQGGAEIVGVALLLGIALAIAQAGWAQRRQMATGVRPPVLPIALGAIVGLPLVAALATGLPFELSYPALKGFNMVGGFQLTPEFAALLLGLTTYTAAFIAEIVRGGIRGVAYGQSEAARAVGLSTGQTLRLVIVPQAMRIIVPPLTNQYLNLVKNSSLAVAIGYPDLVQIFAGTVLNQTGQAIECIFITMAVYLAISLVISVFMNWFNRRVALVER